MALVPPDHAAPPPLALAAGALALLALVVVRRRPLALALRARGGDGGLRGRPSTPRSICTTCPIRRSHHRSIRVGAHGPEPRGRDPRRPDPHLARTRSGARRSARSRHRSRGPPRTRASRPPRIAFGLGAPRAFSAGADRVLVVQRTVDAETAARRPRSVRRTSSALRGPDEASDHVDRAPGEHAQSRRARTGSSKGRRRRRRPTPRRPRAPRRLSSSSYLNSNWFGSGQIPERAVRGSRPRGERGQFHAGQSAHHHRRPRVPVLTAPRPEGDPGECRRRMPPTGPSETLG
jgi:hypothetical protein